MLESRLFAALPEDLVSTPDGMAVDHQGRLVLSCPNFADMAMPSCVVLVDRHGQAKKWFDVPLNPNTNEARSMGIEVGPDGDLYIVDNPGWTNRPDLVRTGRILRIRMKGESIEYVKVIAEGMEHPNGIRIRGGWLYVTQSTMNLVHTPGGDLMSCVYRFRLDDLHVKVTNTLDDESILCTFLTRNPKCQYGVDGIVFDREGRLVIGNFGDGALWRLTLNRNGDRMIDKELWCADADQLTTTDGMTIDPHGNIYVADFSRNAIARVSPEGKITRIAQSPDCTGLEGGLDEPGEPCYWNGKLIVSCFDLVVDDQKVNTAHEMPATLAVLDLDGV